MPDDEYDTPVPRIPDCGLNNEELEKLEVDYSDRHPADWVLSGPLGPNGGGPGRRFVTLDQARDHVTALHGDRVVRRIPEATKYGGNRWAFLIRGER
jgi:hypothetical protein